MCESGCFSSEQHMRLYNSPMYKKKKQRQILLFSLIMLSCTGLILWKINDFLAQESNGMISLFLAVQSVTIAGIAVLYVPKRKSRWYPVYLLFIFLLVPLFLIAGVECLNGNMLWDINYPINVLMNYLLCLGVEIALFALSGSVRISADLTAVLMTLFGIVNMYCKEYKGSPLLPWDITSIVTAANVAGSFTFEITYSVIFMICMTIASMCLAGHLKMPASGSKLKTLSRVLCLTVILVFSYIFWGTDLIATEFGAAPDFFNQTRGYESNGAWAEFMVNTRYLKLAEPSGYDPDALAEEVIQKTGNPPSILQTSGICVSYEPAADNPNLIVIMNESFSDLRVIGDFDTNIEYMPYIDSLIGQENVIEGNVYVSTIGTGTSNTEYEFLTGNPMAFLPAGSNAYQLYVTDTQPGLTSVLKSLGYSADAMHPYNSSSWNRVAVYNAMEFDSFTAIADMKNVEKVRRFASDEYDFNLIREMYEQRDPDTPFYLFNITMQNHSSYETVYENFPQTVELENLEKEYPQTDQYLSLIKETDDQFRKLIEYFSNTEEPVIVLMYGDHQPFIENGFYEEVMGDTLSHMSDEEGQKRYITRFILWANYDIPEGWIDQISVNYLSTLLSEIAGTKMTDYNHFLQYMYSEVPVITQLGCIDRDGVYFKADDDSSFDEDMSLYRCAAYNNLIDSRNRCLQLFTAE